jgi:FKBP-type peptidyl-prolyl cis-trans isomerase FkpA
MKDIRFVFLICIALFLTFALTSCEENESTYQPNYHNNGESLEDSLIKANKYLLKKDKELIESYVKRRDWNIACTESGLWYEIFEKSSDTPIKAGNIVVYDYSLELLDGTVCYTSDSTGAEKIKIGQSGKESGLEEGLKMMKKGEKARFILPPHLAHGLIGNMDRIPQRSVIVYQIEVKDVIDF